MKFALLQKIVRNFGSCALIAYGVFWALVALDFVLMRFSLPPFLARLHLESFSLVGYIFVLSLVFALLGIIKPSKKFGRKFCIPFFAVNFPIALAAGFFLYQVGKCFESTSAQMAKLRKIPEIEEFVITDDEDDFMHDGIMHNDYEIYLTGGRFVKVEALEESLTGDRFKLNAIGGTEIKGGLSFAELSGITGEKINDLNALISHYDAILGGIGNALSAGGRLSPLDTEKLFVREREFTADMRSMPHVKSSLWNIAG